MKKIFLLILSMIVIFLGMNNVSANYTYENNNYTDYRYVEYYNYDDGYRLKHYVLYSDNTRNVGRTELYKNGDLVDYVDTVFFATGSEYVYGDMIGTQRYSKIKQLIKNEDKIEIYYEYRGPNGMVEYVNKNIFYIGGKKEIDDFSSGIYVFGSRGKHFLVKLNLKSNGEIISSKSYYDSLWESGAAAIRGWVWPSVYYGTNGCSFIGIENNEADYKINYKCIVNTIVTGSSAGGPGSTTYKDIFPYFILPKEEYSLCNYNEEYCEQQPIQIPTPINLNQYIIPATFQEREEIQVGSKIGKFQSGSGVIFEAEIDNPESKELRLNIELYKKGETTTKQNYTSDYFTNSGKVFTKILLSEGDYYWNIKIEDRDGNASEIVDFKDNGTDTDFSIFEGFEPYPYGYNFVNGTPVNGMLNGGISGFEVGNYDLRFKISGRKWNIFYKAFDTSEIEDDKRKLFDMFESLGLNNDITLFNNGSCFGLSTLALLKYQDNYLKSKNIPNYLEQNHNRLYTKIKNGNIYDLISNPSSTLNQNWDTYSDDLEDIFAFHLSGNSKNNIDLNDAGVPRNFIGKLIYNPNKILETLKNNPDKKYILNFEWRKANGNLTGHSVITYRVDGNRIYIYDNVSPYGEKYNSYDQYIEIKDNGEVIIKSWPDVNETNLTLMGLMDIEEMNNNGNKSTPKGFNDTDTLYILRGNSDLLITDKDGNKTGYKNGEIYDEIQGTRIVVNYAGEDTDNTWKQIYLPQKLENLTIEINGKVDENYDLMIAGGDYYTKLEGIATSSGQTDIFNISRENIKIDLDDTKTNSGTYNILVDDFQNNGTGSVYLHQLETIKEKQELNIDWNKVINNENDSITYSVDTNNDGIYDLESNFNSLPKSENETGSISGKVISQPSNAGYKVCIDSNNNSKCEENIEQFVVTDNTGYYKFDDLSKGNYTILQETRNNWEIIKPLDKKYTIKLNNGQNIINLNFENSKINGNKNNNK